MENQNANKTTWLLYFQIQTGQIETSNAWAAKLNSWITQWIGRHWLNNHSDQNCWAHHQNKNQHVGLSWKLGRWNNKPKKQNETVFYCMNEVDDTEWLKRIMLILHTFRTNTPLGASRAG